MVPDLYMRMTAGAVRHAFSGAFQYLVLKGWIVEGDAAQLMTVIATNVAVIGWSLWQKYGARKLFVTALKAPANTTEEQVKEIAKTTNVTLMSILLPFCILIPALMATGCPKKTTLDRIGGLTVTGVSVYITQLDGLKIQGVITEAKHLQLHTQALAIRMKAEQFRDQIAALPEIKPNDVRALLAITSDLLALFDASLRDPDIIKLSPDSAALKTLRYARFGIGQAQLAISILFPAPAPGSVTPASGPRVPQRGIAPTKVIVNLQ